MQYNIDHLFFRICKENLQNMNQSDSDRTIPSEETITKAAIIIICSLTGLEAVLNKILNRHIHTTQTISGSKPDEEINLRTMSIKDKIDRTYCLFGKNANWGKKPLQDIHQLITRRNWLVHFKDESFLGILGSNGNDSCWVDTLMISEHETKKHRIPQFDPKKIFNYQQSKKYYEAARSLIKEIHGFLTYEGLNLEDVVNENYRNAVSSN